MSVTAFLLYAILALGTATLYYIHRRLNYWKELGVPHDKPSFVLGSFKGVMRSISFAEISKRTYLKYRGTGPFCGFYFFVRPAVMLLDKQLIKNVLIKDFSKFTDRGMFNNTRDDPLTGHLFLLDGPRWRSLRGKLSPTFSSGKMKFMYPTIIKVAEAFVGVFAQEVAKQNVVELKELLARFTTDVIGTCAFGIDCNSLQNPNAEFREMGRRAFADPRHGRIVGGFLQGFPGLARRLRMCMIHDDISEFFLRIVRETVELRERTKIERNDFMSILIELRNNKKLADNNMQLQNMTIEEMAAQAFVFFIAGFETSSTTIAYTLYELAQQPALQERLRREVNDTMRKHNNEFTYECMRELQYMEQCVSETQRKYTVVPHLNRMALEDYPVPGYPNYVIRKGMPIIIPSIGIHFDPDVYPDPERYDPERFAPAEVAKRDAINWLPFGDGPRMCIGLRFGRMQIRVGLSYLLRNFRFEVCERTEIPIEMDIRSFLLSSKNGIYLKVEPV